MNYSLEEKILADAIINLNEMEKAAEICYRRGDAEAIMIQRMFISVIQESIDRKKQLGRNLTVQEDHQILIDHGWTIKDQHD